YTDYGFPFATVAMRGGFILSTVSGGRYEKMSGTSMAAPNVSSVAAQCLVLAPHLHPESLRSLLIVASVPSPQWPDRVLAGGLVNRANAQKIAALATLMRSGLKPDAAAAKIGMDKTLVGDRALIQLAKTFV